jgi:hypothetical protein
MLDVSRCYLFIELMTQYTSGPLERVDPGSLLPLRGPYFDVRGQVLTTSLAHRNETGEIISIGTNKTGKAFYGVKFKDGSRLPPN